MKKSSLLSICTTALLLLLIINLNVKATNIEVSGSISTNTTWSGVDTVKVIGNIVVHDGITLTIDPGILVEFQGYYYITVEGRLLAVATVSDMITFTVADTTGYHNYSHTGWNGLVFWEIDNANDTSRVVYCKLEYGKATSGGGHSADRGGAVCIAGSHKILFDHCEFQYNYSSGFGGAIFIWNSSNADFSNCNIHHNYSVFEGGGIYSWESHNLYNSIVSNNTSEEGGGGIYLFEGTFNYRNNLIFDNVSNSYGGGIFFNNPYNSTFINLTISNNHAHSGGGIAIENRNPDLRNCIIYGNTVSHSYSQIYYYLFGSTADYHYCDIQDYDGSGVGGDGNSNFSSCIDVDPGFINSGDNPFSLSATSQCINTGDPSTTTTEAGEYDLADNPRIYNGFVDRIDIGAYEYQGDPKPAIVSVWPFDDSKILNTTPTLEIEFSLEVTAQTGYITIYNDDNSIFEQIAANNTLLVTVDSVNVSINPSQDFVFNNSYYIQIDSLALSNINGQKYSGIYDQTSWNFEVIDIYGYPGTSLKFDGTNDYVETQLKNMNGSEITIEYWFKGSSTQSAVRQQHTSGYIVSGWNDKHILSNDGGTTGGILIGASAEDGNWHHIAMTWKQNTTDGFASYLDGQLIEKRNSSDTPLPEIDANVIFGSEYGTHEFMDGDLDEVRIWNIARTISEIRENMNSPLSGSESGLVSYFQFNEGQGTITHDFISGNIGTLTNMTENNWVNSVIPFGAGAVNSQIVSTIGNVDFINTDFTADFTAKTGTDTIVVARIDTIPNITPATVDTVYDSQYWVVNDFGNGTFTANLSFTIAEDLTPDDENNPSNIRLYGRVVTSHHNDWTLITPANIVDATSNTATFIDVSSFGQFMLGRHEGTTPFLMTHLSPDNGGTIYYSHNFEITFNEVATDVDGKSIWLYKSNGTLVEEFTLPSTQVTGSGTDKITINPTNNLVLDEQYYVLIDSGAFQDPFGKDFAGILDPDNWNFRVRIHGHIVSNTTWQDTIIATGNVYVDYGVTLTIAPGTYVQFHEYSKLDIKGTVLAVGTDTDMITFTRMAHNNRWNAIIFQNTSSSNDSSKLVHCILEHAEGDYSAFEGGPVSVVGFNKLLISNCIFRHNSGWSSALDCRNCEFTVNNCIFHNNYADGGGAISCVNNANITLINNVICDNQADNNGGAIYIESSQTVLINNTICNNSVYNEDYETVGGGLFLSSAAITVRNNIIYGNTADSLLNQVYIEFTDHDPDFYYCDIEGGKDAFDGYGAGENYNGTYENNIDETPQFTNTGDHPYQIKLTSPCYNAGDPATTTADVGMFDAAGNTRIENGRIDMGAYEWYRITDDFPGYTLEFNGTDEYIHIPTSSSLNNNHFSVEFWVQMTDLPGEWKGIIDKGRDTNSDWYFLSGESGNEQGIVFGIRNGTYHHELQHSWNDGEWHHIVGIYDGTTMELYIDGVHISSGNATMNVTTNNITIGCRRNINWHFKGKLDEIRIWNVKREAEDIRENMNLSFPGNENGLVSYWQMNEGGGNVTVDYISGNNGILHHDNQNIWHNSDIPFGGGESNSQTISSTGNVSFTNTDVSMNFTDKTGTDIIVVTRIDTIPNVVPEQVNTVFDSQYWVINKFGNGTFTSDITYSLNEDLTPLDESNPNRIKLYGRNNTSNNAWILIDSAHSVNASENKVTFNGIVHFGQFLIAKGNFGYESIDENNVNIDKYKFANYPNPCYNKSEFVYQLPDKSHVNLTVYNTYGQTISILINEVQSPGKHQYELSTFNLSSGIYYYRMVIGKDLIMGKIIKN